MNYTKTTIPRCINDLDPVGVKVYFRYPGDFVAQYNRLIPEELMYKMFQTLNVERFGDLHIICMPSKSMTPNFGLEQQLFTLARGLPVTKHCSEGSLLETGSYGPTPYVVFFRDINQYDPDFVAFSQHIAIPIELRNFL